MRHPLLERRAQDHAADGRDADRDALHEVHVSVDGLARRRQGGDDDYRREARAGSLPLAEAEPQDQEGDDDRAAPYTEQPRKDSGGGADDGQLGKAGGVVEHEPGDTRSALSSSPDVHGELLEPFLRAPDRCAVLTDVDGTLAPIVDRPEDARVPPETTKALATLAGRYALVACVTGRRALEAREMVGVADIVYIGNQGFEILEPGEDEPAVHPAAETGKDRAKTFLAGLEPEKFEQLGVRQEDKGPIQVLHWRGAPDEQKAHALVTAIEQLATHARLIPLWGRKILELRPVTGIDKGSSVHHLLVGHAPLDAALFAGDDRTDLDAFRAITRLAGSPRLGRAVRVGVMTEESPAEIESEADIVVTGTDGVLDIFRSLGG